jgi:hypothetical protein
MKTTTLRKITLNCIHELIALQMCIRPLQIKVLYAKTFWFASTSSKRTCSKKFLTENFVVDVVISTGCLLSVEGQILSKGFRPIVWVLDS